MDQQFLVFAIVIVPVLSVCLGFTVHYAIRPLIESLLDAIQDLGAIGSGHDVSRLQAEVAELRTEVLRLQGSPSRDAELTAASPRENVLSSGSP